MLLPKVKNNFNGPHGAVNVFCKTSGTATDLYANGTKLTSANADRKAIFERYWWLQSEIASAKCPRTLHIPTYVLYIVTAVNCCCSRLLLGITEHVRGSIGLFCKKIFAFQWQNRNVRLMQCKLVIKEQTVALVELKGWNLQPHCDQCVHGQNCHWILSLLMQQHKPIRSYFCKIRDIHRALQMQDKFQRKLASCNRK